MRRFKDWKIGVKLMALILLVSVGYVSFGLIANSTIGTVKVGGPLYDRLVVGRNLNADAAPGTLYLNEARMNILVYLLAEGPPSAQKALENYQTAKKEFNDAFVRYDRQLPEGHIRDLMKGKAHEEGLEWLQVVDAEVIPLKSSGD